MNIRLLLALLAILALHPAQAQQNSARRTQVFAVLPDWTGLWQTDAAVALMSSGPPPAGATPEGPRDSDPVLKDIFRKLMPLAGTPPYNAQWQENYRRSKRSAAAARVTTSASAGCHVGFPGVISNPTPEGMFQVLVTPEQVLFLFGDGEIRIIYTDGRLHPKREDRWPTNMGDSIGHWEGKTLVIDTIARTAGPVSSGGPVGEPAPYVGTLSDQAHFTERVRMIDANRMRDDLTIDDPQRFAHPWKVTIRYLRVTDADRMILYSCEGHDRNPIVNGHLTIAPP